MSGNAGKVSQEKSVLLKDNSESTPHNQSIKDITLAYLSFCNKAVFVVEQVHLGRQAFGLF